MSASITQYLRSGLILASNSPQYDDKGRQLPFQESPSQRDQRHAFVKSIRCQRNVAKWMHNQGYAHSSSTDPHSSSTSSSESSSPRTPASPLTAAHTHPVNDTLQQQKMKLQTAEALDAELQKLIQASRNIHPPQHRQSRNYKNLHLPNTTSSPYQPQSGLSTSTSQPQRAQAPATTPPRGIFDSPNTVFSSYHNNEVSNGGEPYIFYSSSSSFSALASHSNPSTAKSPAAGIGEFPYPTPRSSSHSRSISSPAPLTSPSSSLSPRTLTSF